MIMKHAPDRLYHYHDFWPNLVLDENYLIISILCEITRIIDFLDDDSKEDDDNISSLGIMQHKDRMRLHR